MSRNLGIIFLLLAPDLCNNVDKNKLEVGSWKSEVRSKQLEVGSMKLEVMKLEVRTDEVRSKNW